MYGGCTRTGGASLKCSKSRKMKEQSRRKGGSGAALVQGRKGSLRKLSSSSVPNARSLRSEEKERERGGGRKKREREREGKGERKEKERNCVCACVAVSLH